MSAAERFITEHLAVAASDDEERAENYIAALQEIRAYLMDREHLDDWGVPVIYLGRLDEIIAANLGLEVAR